MVESVAALAWARIALRNFALLELFVVRGAFTDYLGAFVELWKQRLELLLDLVRLTTLGD